MDEQRIEAYVNLIQALIQCPQGEELSLLQENQELLDEGFLATLGVIIQQTENNDLVQFLQQVAEWVQADLISQNSSSLGEKAALISQNSSSLGEKAALTPQTPSSLGERGSHSTKEGNSQEYLTFLQEVLQAEYESNSDQKVIFPILKKHLNKLDLTFAEVLINWGKETCEQVDSQQKQRIVGLIQNLVIDIQEFPLGNQAINQEIAIQGYQFVLSMRPRELYPEQWGQTQNNLANAYLYRIRGDKAENLEWSIECYHNALQVRTQSDFPMDWAMTQNNLATAYRNRIRGDKAENLEWSIECYHNALQVRTQSDFPIQWAMTQNNLANAYSDRIRGDKAENLEWSIECFHNALQVRTPSDFPMDWAMTQNNLATAYRDRIRGDKAENLEWSIECYHNALQVRTRSDFPIQWAGTQNNLAIAYSDRIRGDKAENLELSIECYHNALQVYTQSDFPLQWAMTQNNLAVAYRNRIRGDKAENLEWSIECYHNALQVYTQSDFPMDWAMTQNNLAAAYTNRIRGDKAENLELSIECYHKALQVRTQSDFPMDWAMTQNNLATAYLYRIRGDKAENLEWSIECYHNALQVLTQSDFPMDWAMTQNNLATAYRDRIRGDKAENLELSIECYHNALQVRTQSDFPLECLQTARNLGNLHYDHHNYPEAIKAYHLAIESVENSRLSALTPQRKQEIISDAINIFDRMVQCQINLNQLETALEYIERSKTRNLVESLSNRDIMPKGDISTSILTELNRLRNAIREEENRLAILERNRNYNETNKNQAMVLNITKLNQLKEELKQFIQREIIPIDPTFNLTETTHPISFKELQTLIDDQTAIIQWYITADQIHTFIITRHHDQPILKSFPSQDQNQLIDEINNYRNLYASHINTGLTNWTNQLPQYLQNFSQFLHLEEIIASIPNTQYTQLILIPHWLLHILPLHAIPVQNNQDKTPTSLQEIYPNGINYSPSGQLLKIIKQQLEKRPHFNSLLAISNPENNLKYGDLEAEVILSFFPKGEILSQNNASEAVVKSHPQLSLANCIHFSCHGRFNPNSPLESCLALCEDIDQKEDGKLTLEEIFKLDLNQCRLVSLSACETGLTDVNYFSDEYIGLPHGFLFAGSPCIIHSLWSVEEGCTALLMVKFYENLFYFLTKEKRENPVALALSEAQYWLKTLTQQKWEDWIKTSNIPFDATTKNVFKTYFQGKIEESHQPFQNPYYWAGFCTTGL